jgi:hypothetical protein
MFARRLFAQTGPATTLTRTLWRTPPTMSLTTRAQPTVEPSALFAVVHVSGHQYKVSVGDVITTQRIREANVGDAWRCDKVLAIGGGLKFFLFHFEFIFCFCLFLKCFFFFFFFFVSQFYHSRHAARS